MCRWIGVVSVLAAIPGWAELQNVEINGARMIFSGHGLENFQDIAGGTAHGWVVRDGCMHSGPGNQPIQPTEYATTSHLQLKYRVLPNDETFIEFPGDIVIQLHGGTALGVLGLADQAFLELAPVSEGDYTEWHRLRVERMLGRLKIHLNDVLVLDEPCEDVTDNPTDPLRFWGNGKKALFETVTVGTGRGGIQIRRNHVDALREEAIEKNS